MNKRVYVLLSEIDVSKKKVASFRQPLFG